MVKNKYLKILYYIGFVLVFFPMFCIFFVPNTRAYIGYGTLIWLLLYLYCLVQNPKRFLLFIKSILKHKIIKTYLYFMIYIFFTTFFHIVLGAYRANIGHYIARIIDFLTASIAMYLFPVLSVYFKININKIIKLFYLGIFIVLFIGIIQYIGMITNMNFIQSILDVFSNQRFYWYKLHPENYKNLLRIHSIFPEPSDLGKFIFIMMPFGFEVFQNKYKFIKNNLLNIIFKKSILPMMIICTVLTKSPMYLILCLVEIGVFFIYYNIKNIKRYFIIFVIMSVVSMFTLISLYFSTTFQESQQYERIKTTIENTSSFEGLVLFSASLACRLVSYRTHIEIWKENKIFGVGLCNEGLHANNLYNKIRYPVTIENMQTYNAHPTLWGLNESVVWSTLSNCGIVGILFLINFLYQNFKSIKKSIISSYGIEKSFNRALFESLIVICIISFYNLVLTSLQLWFVLGQILLVSIHHRISYKYVINEQHLIKRRNDDNIE